MWTGKRRKKVSLEGLCPGYSFRQKTECSRHICILLNELVLNSFSSYQIAEGKTEGAAEGGSSQDELTETELFSKYYTEWKDQSKSEDSTFNTIPKFYYKVRCLGDNLSASAILYNNLNICTHLLLF